GDEVLVLFARGQVVDLVGDRAVDHATVRCLNEAEGVDAGEGCQRADQTDVRAFRRFDRAHTAVVAGVHVTNLNTGTLTAQTTGAQRREATLVGQTRERVVLVHELRQLRGSEELL